MDELPELSEEEIRDWTDSTSFSRGKSYYSNGAIANPRVQGMELRADCRGSAPAPYRVEMTLDEEGIVSGYCSCPVGGGGTCKHCVALLLTWLYTAESFTTQEVTQSRLAERSREELVALIEKMIGRYPDLADLLDMPIAGLSAPTARLDPEVIRRQVSSAVDNAGYDDRRRGYGDADLSFYTIAGEGRGYLAAGEWANAVTVYATLAEGVMESYEEMYDDEGEIVSVVDSCAEGLGKCLGATSDPDLRQQIIQTLFDIYRWDINSGGLGGGDSAYSALIGQTNSEEKADVAGSVRAALATQKRASADTKAFGGFLLQLEADTLSDEEYLRLCRETGRNEDLVRRLLVLGRSDEAAEAAKAASAHELLTLSNIIYAAGHTQLAEQTLRDQIEQMEARNVLGVLQQVIDWTLARNAPAEALPLTRRLLGQAKSLAAYQQVRKIAGLVGRWSEIQTELLQEVEKEKNFLLLTQIYVEEGRVDDALAALTQTEKTKQRSYYFEPSGLRLSVARLAEETRPAAAIEIYRAQAQQEIAGRQRDRYASAARHLQQVKRLYARLGETAKWSALIAQIRQENSRLRALKEELTKAGL